MNEQGAAIFLFTVAKEIKHSLESPVILVTEKDYAEGIVNSLIQMRTALLQQAATDRVADIINNFHIEWLQAVEEIESFKKRVKNTPRDVFLKALEYTIESIKNRRKHLQKINDQAKLTMTLEEKALIQTDLDIIDDMGNIVNSTLLQKQTCMRNLADSTEFCCKINDEIEELLNWLDKLNDNLALQFCKMLNLQVPQLTNDLAKTQQNIVDEIAESTDPNSRKLASTLSNKEKKPGSIVHIDNDTELEILKVIGKIKVLENRIECLKNENSSAVMALQHKSLYLAERLQSLQNLKESLNNLRNQSGKARSEYPFLECKKYQIFNHMLPKIERCRLVEQLVKLWDAAVSSGCDRQSIISILSVADIKEVFIDDIGQFTVDKHGRKLYSKGDDNLLYQLNENNQLVPVLDDEKHVYFYDECGRYYVNDLRQRIYKAHESASEYLLQNAGVLIKVREEIDGIEYCYDELGRYYTDKFGKRIYYDGDSNAEYEHDGLGNLVKIREEYPFYDVCPREPLVMEEMKYLKEAIGSALKTCLAEVVIHQPPDPVLYLAQCLEKYRENIEMRQRRLLDESDMKAERLMFSLCTHMSPQGGAEEEYESDHTLTN